MFIIVIIIIIIIIIIMSLVSTSKTKNSRHYNVSVTAAPADTVQQSIQFFILIFLNNKC